MDIFALFSSSGSGSGSCSSCVVSSRGSWRGGSKGTVDGRRVYVYV